MPFGYSQPASWLREDDSFDRYNKPGASDWFSLSDDVRFDKPNNRHDAFKVESLLGYGGYMDMEKSGGPMGLATGRLEKPIKEFQAQNGLKIDGLLKPGGPTITKMKELYGDVFGGTPAPTPAMVDANAEVSHAGEDGFLYDKGPSFGVRPNKRLDGKAHLMEYERWNRDWARGSGNDPKSLAPEYESYIRDLDDEHGHDPGLIFARDLVQQVGKFHGQENGAELAKALAVRLSDRPDLQRELLGGPVPTSPPIGMFKPGGEERIKTWIDQDRVANGLAPRYMPSQNDVPVLRTASHAAPASQDAAQHQPDPANLLEYGPNFGLPEDWALAQQPPHEPDQPNPRPVAPPSQSDPQGKSDGKPGASRAPAAGEVDPNEMSMAGVRRYEPNGRSDGAGSAGTYDPNQMNTEGMHRRSSPDNARGFADEFPRTARPERPRLELDYGSKEESELRDKIGAQPDIRRHAERTIAQLEEELIPIAADRDAKIKDLVEKLGADIPKKAFQEIVKAVMSGEYSGKDAASIASKLGRFFVKIGNGAGWSALEHSPEALRLYGVLLGEQNIRDRIEDARWDVRDSEDIEAAASRELERRNGEERRER